MKLSWDDIRKRLTGFSTPIFGVSWDPPEPERQAARKLLTYFEGRRVFYNPSYVEHTEYTVLSVAELRSMLTQTLQQVGPTSKLADHVRAMRAACRTFVDEIEHQKVTTKEHLGKVFYDDLRLNLTYQALAALRATFGIHIAQIAVEYGIDVDENLSRILPAEERPEDVA